jgi:hypothetical protein
MYSLKEYSLKKAVRSLDSVSVERVKARGHDMGECPTTLISSIDVALAVLQYTKSKCDIYKVSLAINMCILDVGLEAR